MAEFLAMGGYALYVWSSFAVTLIVLGGLAVASRRDLAAKERELEALQAASPHRQRKRSAAS